MSYKVVFVDDVEFGLFRTVEEAVDEAQLQARTAGYQDKHKRYAYVIDCATDWPVMVVSAQQCEDYLALH